MFKKILLGAVGVLLVAVVAVLAVAMTKPEAIHVERSITIDAPPADMAAFAENLELVNAWSPWDEKDPNLKRSYSDAKQGVGAWYAWDGNDDVGSGKMTVTTSEPGKVVHKLEFFTPFEGHAQSSIVYGPEGDGTKVTWNFDQTADFMGKVMQVFMSMDDMIGPDYEKGLAMLKPQVEAAAKERAAAEAKAAEEAAKLAEAEADGGDPDAAKEADAAPTAE